MTPINTNYEKIVDDLYYMGSNIIVKFNVSLARKKEDGSRNSFHHEFEYTMNKYISTRNLVTIKRQFEYYLSIENIKAIDGQREYIYIGVQDFMQFQQRIIESTKWFTSSEFENLFAKKDDKIIMLGKVEPIDISFNKGNKSIRVEPIILNYEDKTLTGVRFYLCSLDNYVDIDVDRYMGFVYLISTLNMFQSAQIMLNYIGRPEDGTNRMSFNSGDNRDSMEEGVYCKTNRLVNYKPKSFFNKVDEM